MQILGQSIGMENLKKYQDKWMSMTDSQKQQELQKVKQMQPQQRNALLKQYGISEDLFNMGLQKDNKDVWNF